MLQKHFQKKLMKEVVLEVLLKYMILKRPFEPKGAVAQAWSVAEVFRIITRS